MRANVEAFAAAALGRAPYPMRDEEKLATVAALEAVFRSAESGRVEVVEGLGSSPLPVGEGSLGVSRRRL